MDKKRTKNSELAEVVFSSASDIHGVGLFANRRIGKGEYIGTYHGPMAKRNGTYVLWVYDEDDESEMVGRSGKNILRYLNHAKPGNVEFDGFDLFARIGINAMDELTFNYEAD